MENLHPNACLHHVRNISSGLRARTKILNLVDASCLGAPKIAKETGMSYGAVTHHLRLLKNEGIVERKGSKPYIWLSTGFGQKRLV